MTYGLTPQGFVPKDLSKIAEELRDDIRNTFGNDINVEPDSIMGQIIDIFSAKLSETWELGENVYGAFDLNTASGTSLDNVMTLLGLERQPATRTTLAVNLFGDANAVAPAGTLFRDTHGRIWELMDEVTFPDPTTDMYGNVRCQEYGPIDPELDTITEIATPVPGLISVENGDNADIIVGQGRETDSEFRARAKQSLYGGGAGVDKAIEARLLALGEPARLTSAQVFSNRTMNVDAHGLPAKSFQAIVYPKYTDTDAIKLIGETIFLSQPAGIASHGSTTVYAVDNQGYSQPVKFSFAEETPISVEVWFTSGTGDPSPVEQAIIYNTVETYCNSLRVGETFINGKLKSLIYNALEVAPYYLNVESYTNAAPVQDDGNKQPLRTQIFHPDDIIVNDET